MGHLRGYFSPGLFSDVLSLVFYNRAAAAKLKCFFKEKHIPRIMADFSRFIALTLIDLCDP